MSYEYKDNSMYGAYDRDKILTVEELHEMILNMKFETRDLYDGAITTNKIADFAVDSAKIGEAVIGEAHIGKAVIGEAHIQDLAVGRAKIAEAAIGSAQIDHAVINEAHIQDASIKRAHIQDAAIGNAQIENASITNAKIQDATIEMAKIKDLEVDTAYIKDASITEAKIGDLAVSSAKIADAAIGSAKIGDLAVTTAKIEVGAITSALIDDAAIGTVQIADGSITDAKIVELTASKLTAGRIDAAEIEVINLVAENITVGQINGQQIAPGAIDMDHIAEGSISNHKIVDNAITSTKILDDSIETSKIAANAITANEIATNAVTAVKVKANAITASKIATNAVIADKIAANAITTTKIHADAVTSDKIVADAITTRHVASKAITANEIDVTDLRVGRAQIVNGAIGTAQIEDASITSAKVERLSADKIIVGAESLFEDGFDPTKLVFGNLVKNPELTGSHTGWSNTKHLTSNTQTFEGVGTRVLAQTQTTSGQAQTYSSYFDIDPSKAYEVSMWVRKSRAVGIWYMGLNGVDSSGGSVGFKNNRATGLDTNFYFERATSAKSTWTKLVGYIMPVGTPLSELSGLGTTQYGAVFEPNHKRVRVRWLNWNNGTSNSTMYVAMPKVVETDPNAIIAGTHGSDMAKIWQHEDTTYIDGGKIYAGSVTANEMKTGTITAASGIIANAAITNAKIANATIETAKIKDAAITTAKIGNAQITTAKIGDAQITNAKIKDLDAEKIKAGTITGMTIRGGKIESDTTINVNTDLHVGDSIYVGNQSNDLYKRIQFSVRDYIERHETGLGMNGNTVTALGRDLVSLSLNEGANTSRNVIIGVSEGETYISGFKDLELDSITGKIMLSADVQINETLIVNGRVNAMDFVFSDAFESHPDTKGLHVYVRPKSGGELRVTRAGTTSTYEALRAGRLISQGHVIGGNNASFESASGYVIVRAGGDGSGVIYLQTNGHVRATRVGQASSYVPISASAFDVNSTLTSKQDIEIWEDSALDIVNDAVIHQYRRKDDVKYGDGRIRHGFVIGEGFKTPQSIINSNGEGADLYEMASTNWKATQELYSLVTKLYDRIELLEQGRD